MDPSDERIADEFNNLVDLGRDEVNTMSFAHRAIFYIVATRCEIDIDGFSSVYEQDLNPSELATLVAALEAIGESDLASAFDRGYRLLEKDGFYNHRNWKLVPPETVAQIELIGEQVGDYLWDLDAKLVSLLDGPDK